MTTDNSNKGTGAPTSPDVSEACERCPAGPMCEIFGDHCGAEKKPATPGSRFVMEVDA